MFLTLLPRALTRGLESESDLGVLTSEPDGPKPDGIDGCLSFRDLKVAAIPKGRGNT